MGSVVELKPKAHGFAHSLTFTEADEDFGNLNDARAYLRAREFSVGPIDGKNPIGILFGENLVVGKWSKLSTEDLNDLHGKIVSRDFRRGAVTVSIRADAPAAAIAAFHTEDVSGDGRPDAALPTGADPKDAPGSGDEGGDRDIHARLHVERVLPDTEDHP